MSDHFSGPRALAGPHCDICDVYAFPSPERSGHLALVMNVLPNAGPSALFSDAIIYRFRLRTVAVGSVGQTAAFIVAAAEELVFDCTFDVPRLRGGAHPLTELLLSDHLIVDISKSYAEDSFFEIERSMLQGRAHATCGGRSLNDDAMDALYTLLINAERGPRISDHVDKATVPAYRTFPYLAPPNPPKSAAARGEPS